MERVKFDKRNNRIPIKMWLDYIENGAMLQAENLSKLFFSYRQIVLLPDCHQGYGMPIGTVLATHAYIIPNAVGVDIGCGMRAIKLNVVQLKKEKVKELMSEIREVIPVGFKHNEEANSDALPPLHWNLLTKDVIPDELQSAAQQLGTLGGGNHFIEFQVGEDNSLWIMLHSGSRNLGYKVASHYNQLAKDLNAKWHTQVAPSYDLAFLPVDSKEGQDYLKEMNYCVEFAEANRRVMMDKIKNILDKHLLSAFIEEDIDVIHNYVRQENHFGKNVWVHRKGAISARLGEIGIIPGSQGSFSYITKGLGNPESFTSCSHGAGRKMSRSKAKAELDLAEEQHKLELKGVIHSVRTVSQLDEAPSAYKNIDKVMELQKDLCEIKERLIPIGVIKG
ncbi:MAG: RtcB family protein [Candidatus Atribacteria bacterium]|nr:MAG: RtcB family protein [Candidatus Atribacteria bacterium]